MSTPEPPDRPTERLAPSRTEHRVVEQAPVADLDALARLEDAIASLRTGVMIAGVIAVAALGVALYAILRDDGGTAGSGASQERVSRLDDRVDRLSSQLQDARSSARGAADVDDRVEALEKAVEDLAERPASDPQQAIDELSGRIDEVAKNVEELEQQAQQAPQTP